MTNPKQAERVCFCALLGCILPMDTLSAQRTCWRRALLITLALVIRVSVFPPVSVYSQAYRQVDSQNEPTDDADEPATHTVQRGETLSEIAVSLGVSMPELMQLNGITDSDAIYVGQILRIPLDVSLRRADAESAAAEAPDLGAPVLPGASHTVRRGETLSEIAQAYGVEMSELMRINGIADPDSVYVGQTLDLPVDTPANTSAGPTADAQVALPATVLSDVASADEQPAIVPTDTPQANEPSITNTDTNTDTNDAGEAVAEELTPLQRTTTLNQRYTVRANDSLARIALRAGVDLDALRQINGFGSDDIALVVGQELLLPATFLDTTVEPEVEETGLTYAVEPGDSLSGIAKAYDLSLAELMDANGIVNPDSIRIGQSLRIPPPPEAATEENAPVIVGPMRRGFYYYTVGVGDTLSQLADELGSTVLALLEYNGLPDEETVYLGLELRVPYGPPPVPVRHPRIPQSGTRFMVSLSRQQCWVFRGERVVHAWTCSTGYGQHTTRTGTFAVQTRMEMAQSSAYQLDMPYWLGIYDVGTFENGIHGLPVRWDTGKKIWTHLIGQPATFGCAMLADEEAAQLFDISYLGMPVHVVE